MKFIKDNDGNVLYDIVAPLAQDMNGKAALFERNKIKAFLELHIEQGPILENNQKILASSHTLLHHTASSYK